MQTGTIAIKGNRDGLLIILDAHEEWQAIMHELAARIDGQSSFFTGARITLDVGQRPLRKDELMTAKALLERRNLTLWAVASASVTAIDSATALDLHTHYDAPAPASEAADPDAADPYAAFSPEEDGTTGVMIRRTLRNGRTVHSRGHVVILGDVNAGAEIIALGDVIIWGRLRGNVHAGADGDETAVVCALDLMPTQLRIAGYLAVSPPDKRRKPQPEIARIDDGQIVVDLWAHGE
jgi:septum site-determining protein MinC